MAWELSIIIIQSETPVYLLVKPPRISRGRIPPKNAKKPISRRLIHPEVRQDQGQPMKNVMNNRWVNRPDLKKPQIQIDTIQQYISIYIYIICICILYVYIYMIYRYIQYGERENMGKSFKVEAWYPASVGIGVQLQYKK